MHGTINLKEKLKYFPFFKLTCIVFRNEVKFSSEVVGLIWLRLVTSSGLLWTH
jgi:hypothetical protein